MITVNGAKAHCSKQPTLKAILPTPRGYIKCMAISGNGVRTGMVITR